MPVRKYYKYSAMYDVLNDPKAAFSLEKEQLYDVIEEVKNNSFEGKESFVGKILSAPVELGETTGATPSGDTKAKKVFFAKARLDDVEDNILEDPNEIIDPSMRNLFQGMHKTAAFSPADGQNIVAHAPGDQVEFKFSISGPLNEGKLRGLEFTDNVISRANGNYSYAPSSGASAFQSNTPVLIGNAAPIPNTNYRPPQKRIYRGVGGEFEIYNGILREGLVVTSKASLYGTKILIDAKEDFENLANAFYEADLTKERKIQASSFRSYEGQVSVYEDPSKITTKQKKDGTKYESHLGAYPGTSKHGWAVAIDINTRDKKGVKGFNSEVYRWMMENAGRFNFWAPSWARATGSKPEAWHWEHGTIDAKFVVKHKFIFRK